MLGQSTLRLHLREFEPSQYEELAHIYDKLYPEYRRSANEWKFWDENLDRSKYYFQRYTCNDQESGAIAGFGQLGHAPWTFHPRKYWIDIWVDPEKQGQGIGRAIFDKLAERLSGFQALTAWTAAKEDMPAPIGFLERRGFMQIFRAWESRLKPEEVDTSRFSEYSTKAAKSGITISSLSKEKREDPECYKKLHELVQLASADMPSPEPYTPLSLEQWESFEMKNPDLAPDAYMIAKDGQKYVGLSTVWLSETDGKGLYQGLTGVRREYRGRGIAYTLKLKVIEFAQKNEFDLIKTWNASINAPMLAINIKLGFKRQVGWITFEKNLS